MQSIVVVIILLSLIGLYINISVDNLVKPELKKDERENISVDDVAQMIAENIDPEPEFDSMGNSLKVGNGLEEGKRIINLGVQDGNAPNTRPGKWTSTTKKPFDENGIVRETLSYKNNFPYNVNDVATVIAPATLGSMMNTARWHKGEQIVSQIILPNNPDRFDANNIFFNRATNIAKAKVAHTEKNHPYMLEVNSGEIGQRASKKIHRVMPKDIDLKDNPDFMSINAARDHADAHSNLQKLDAPRHAISVMTGNYNLK